LTLSHFLLEFEKLSTFQKVSASHLNICLVLQFANSRITAFLAQALNSNLIQKCWWSKQHAHWNSQWKLKINWIR